MTLDETLEALKRLPASVVIELQDAVEAALSRMSDPPSFRASPRYSKEQRSDCTSLDQISR